MSDFTVAAIATVGIVLAGKYQKKIFAASFRRYQFLIGNVRLMAEYEGELEDSINSS